MNESVTKDSLLCGACRAPLCNNKDLAFLIQDDDALLTILPAKLEVFLNAGVVSMDEAKNNKKRTAQVNCIAYNQKCGSEITVRRNLVICFGPNRVSLNGLKAAAKDKWLS